MANVQQMSPGNISGGGVSRNITILQRSTLRFKEGEYSDQGKYSVSLEVTEVTRLVPRSLWPIPILFKQRWYWI